MVINIDSSSKLNGIEELLRSEYCVRVSSERSALPYSFRPFIFTLIGLMEMKACPQETCLQRLCVSVLKTLSVIVQKAVSVRVLNCSVSGPRIAQSVKRLGCGAARPTNRGNIYSFHSVQTVCGASPNSNQWAPWFPSAGVKQPGRKADHSPSYSVRLRILGT
jgi:hypothetical protein